MSNQTLGIPGNYREIIGPFYQAFGCALTRWQHVESSLFIVAYAAMECEYKISSTIYFHITSQDSKLKLTNKLCEIYFSENEEALKEWKVFYNRIGEAIKARNKFAHFEVSYVTDSTCLVDGEPPFALSSPHFNIKENNDVATTNVLNAFAEEFLTLTKELLTFVRKNFDIEVLRSRNLPPFILEYLQKHSHMDSN